MVGAVEASAGYPEPGDDHGYAGEHPCDGIDAQELGERGEMGGPDPADADHAGAEDGEHGGGERVAERTEGGA